MGELLESWRNFQAEACECFDPKDKERMLMVIGNANGGLGKFNMMVSEFLTRISESVEATTSAGENETVMVGLSSAGIDLFCSMNFLVSNLSSRISAAPIHVAVS